MMKFYAEVGKNLQMVDEADMGCPEGWIEMQYRRPEDENTLDYTAQEDGTWVITQETINAKLAIIENAWRIEEMKVIVEQLLMLEDDDTDALPGTETQWRAYRIVLRKWIDGNPDFPDSTKRPTRPT